MKTLLNEKEKAMAEEVLRQGIHPLFPWKLYINNVFVGDEANSIEDVKRIRYCPKSCVNSLAIKLLWLILLITSEFNKKEGG